jgi:hypothetical protein
VADPLQASSVHGASVLHTLERCGSSLNSSDDVQHILILRSDKILKASRMQPRSPETNDDGRRRDEGGGRPTDRRHKLRRKDARKICGQKALVTGTAERSSPLVPNKTYHHRVEEDGQQRRLEGACRLRWRRKEGVKDSKYYYDGCQEIQPINANAATIYYRCGCKTATWAIHNSARSTTSQISYLGDITIGWVAFRTGCIRLSRVGTHRAVNEF